MCKWGGQAPIISMSLPSANYLMSSNFGKSTLLTSLHLVHWCVEGNSEECSFVLKMDCAVLAKDKSEYCLGSITTDYWQVS